MRPPSIVSLALLLTAATAIAEPLRFNRDIRPILSENCFHCHGQDPKERKAGVRLDTLEGALEVMVPGRPEESELLRRMVSTDPDEVMPPKDSHRQVNPEQIALVRRWIEEGGKYEEHWAFVPPQRTEPPAIARTDWPRAPWDAWVLARLEKEGLAPSPEASPEAWLRRVSFDLTGLAPTPEESAAFLQDVAASGEAAHGRAADRLLASPRYGERMASEWLDVARYADTHGFNNDSARSMWRWRDWVIEAFNTNLPSDQFITKQLAGDLLPGATLDDRLATGFGRNHVINSEGGIIDEEYRVEYVADRVRTLGMAWLGLTLECARCHDHKFDPISTRDYYQFFAFFNQVPEWGEDGRIANAAPFMAAPTREQQATLAAFDRKLAVAKAELAAAASRAALPDAVRWVRDSFAAASAAATEMPAPAFRLALREGKPLNDAKPETPLPMPEGLAVAEAAGLGPVVSFPEKKEGPEWRLEPAQASLAGNAPWSLSATVRWQGGEAAVFSNMAYDRPFSSTSHGEGLEVRVTADGRLEARVATKWPVYATRVLSKLRLAPGGWHDIAVVNQGGGRAADFSFHIDGQESEVEVLHDGLTGGPGARAVRLGATNEEPPARWQGEIAGLAFYAEALTGEQAAAVADAAFAARVRAHAEPAAEGTHEAASRAGLAGLSELSTLEKDRARRLLLAAWPATRDHSARLSQLWFERLALIRAFPTSMVMAELPEPRPTHVLNRGVYDAPGARVEAGVPETVLGAWPEGAPRNRLGLAQWLTRPSHPLTARVIVNRFWQQLFGVGLVKTSEDFGYQGEYPSHPELLDALALDFVESGWDVKRLLRGIVLSATYRQDSRAAPALQQRDPENRLLARGPRFRLPAEALRDHALAASGLLRERVGGPSVYPDQPPDLYKGVVVDAPYPGSTWTPSTGDDLYRRSLYTFWKRTVPHPVMTVLDAPDREFGCVRRSRTNTPMQALALMNEPALLRAAGHLGQRMRREGGPDDAARLAYGFRLAASRAPSAGEQAILADLLNRLRLSYQNDSAAAEAMRVTGGLEPKESAPDPTETAAWTALASTLLNLDETLTKN